MGIRLDDVVVATVPDQIDDERDVVIDFEGKPNASEDGTAEIIEEGNDDDGNFDTNRPLG